MSWVKVCSVDELPERQLIEMTAGGIDMLLARTANNVVAIPPLCPHMKEPLVNGIFDGETLTCLKHLWQWDIASGASLGEAEKPLCQYPARVKDGCIEVEVSEVLEYDYEL